jgi:cytochrome P450
MFHDPELTPFKPRSRPSLRAAVSNRIENWPREAYCEDHAVVQGIWPLLPKMLLLTDPALVEDVLVTRAEKFVRDSFQTRALSNMVSRDSLFFAEAGHWRWQRRAVSPAFRQESVYALVPTFARCAEMLVDEWRRDGNGTAIDVAPAMSKVTFSIILEAVLGVGARILDQDKLLAALNPALSTVAWRFFYAQMGLPEAMPFPGSHKAAKSIRWLYQVISHLVQDSRARTTVSKDILALLLSAKDPESGRAMSDSELIANLYTFMVAGHETSATALAWTLWLLAKDPATQENVRAEVNDIIRMNEIQAEDVERLTFTRQVLLESMRLFPPATGVGRTPREDIKVGPCDIRKGELVLVATWAIHRHEKLWDEPNGFDPSRFAPEMAKARHRCVYLPFGAGPRICVGMSFAMTEMIVLLATLVRRFRFKTAPGHHLVIATNLTPRAKNGLPLVIETI